MTSYHQTKIKKIRNNIKTEIFSSHVNKYKIFIVLKFSLNTISGILKA